MCGQEPQKLLIIGSIPANSRRPPEISIASDDPSLNEALHIVVNLEERVVQRYSVIDGASTEVLGRPFEGTTIDPDEPFILNLSCDEDGWMVQVNVEEPYPHYMHVFPLLNITTISVQGDFKIDYVGIGKPGELV